MIVTDTGFRMWYKKEYGKDLPKDKYYGVDYKWSDQELEMAEKYLNGECFNDFNGIDLLEYAKDYNDKLLELDKYNNILSKEAFFEILENLRNLYEAKIIKQINYTLLLLVMDYKIIYDKNVNEDTFKDFILKKLKINGNHKEWLG